MPPDLFIIGASTRALADSAFRLGLQATCLDQYADADLARKALLVQPLAFDESGRPLVSAETFRNLVGQTPWTYTGPLENQPEWLAQAADATTLYGNSAAVCRRVRNLTTLAEWLVSQNSPITMPQMRPGRNRPSKSAGWLWKPVNSSGGWDILRARTKFSRQFSIESPETGYWQKQTPGPAFGVTIASDTRSSVVLGTCRSLHGAPGRPFAYAGSAGPARARHVRRLEPILGELATELAKAFGLKGLWNIDVVCDPQRGRWFLLEINPRPSASMEVLELAAGQSLLAIHLAIFCNSGDAWLSQAEDCKKALGQCRRPVAKRIIYARRPMRFTRHSLPPVCMEKWPSQPFFADIPHPGTTIPAGYPVMTSFEF